VSEGWTCFPDPDTGGGGRQVVGHITFLLFVDLASRHMHQYFAPALAYKKGGQCLCLIPIPKVSSPIFVELNSSITTNSLLKNDHQRHEHCGRDPGLEGRPLGLAIAGKRALVFRSHFDFAFQRKDDVVHVRNLPDRWEVGLDAGHFAPEEIEVRNYQLV
jgi:hypothetical protein